MQKSATLPLHQKQRGPEVPVAGWNKEGGIAAPQESSDIAFDEHLRSLEGVGLLLFEESLIHLYETSKMLPTLSR